MSRTVTGVDVGTTKVCTIIGEMSAGRLRILGVGVVPAQGLRKGVVVNIDEAVESIVSSVEKCQKISGLRIDEVNVSIANSNITSQNSKGIVAVANSGHDIGHQDIERALEAARTVAIPSNRDVIHVIPRGYVVDGLDGVKNPIGMAGSRLEVETHIICGGSGAIQNLLKCIERAGIETSHLVLEPLASAEAVLTESEREAGVMVVDIGGGTTDTAIFADGGVLHTSVLPVGGSHITNDVAIGLRAPYEVAEELKIKYGRATTEGVLADEPIRLNVEGASQHYLRADLCEIIEARADEILTLVKDDLRASGWAGRLPAGAVITGGTAQLIGLSELAANILDMPVRIGVPTDIEGLVDTIANPAYASSVGLVRWGFTHAAGGANYDDGRASQPSGEMYSRLRGWLRAFLP